LWVFRFTVVFQQFVELALIAFFLYNDISNLDD
jgi:hypothetical protein